MFESIKFYMKCVFRLKPVSGRKCYIYALRTNFSQISLLKTGEYFPGFLGMSSLLRSMRSSATCWPSAELS